VRESVKSGADVVCFSGDKLIGGPQSGIIVGKREPVERIRNAPLARMLRIDKLTDIALENTLSLFLEPDSLPAEHPVYTMLTVSLDRLKRNARALVKKLQGLPLTSVSVAVEPAESRVGGGTLPGVLLPSVQVSIEHRTLSADACARFLRRFDPPIATRVADGAVKVNMRTLLPKDDIHVLSGIALLDTEGDRP
jgi:L-seryl-tRNA(Ser) seleniumtransferase